MSSKRLASMHGQPRILNSAADYHFLDQWRVRGTVREVAAALSDGPDLARWWPSTYLSVTQTAPGDSRGVGQTGQVHARGWLPYTIRFDYRINRVNYPYGFEVEAAGDLTGRGVWDFAQHGPWVNITYDWRVRAEKPIIRATSFLLKSVYRSNHTWTMRQGEKSLQLELARRQAKTQAARMRVPPPPNPQFVVRWFVALVAMLVTLFKWLFSNTVEMEVVHRRIIRAPLARVFNFVTAVEHDVQWQPDIREVRLISRGPPRVGSRFIERRQTFGIEFLWTMRITSFEHNHRIAIESIEGTVPYRGSREFRTVEGGTEIVETSVVRLPRLCRPLFPLIGYLASRAVSRAYSQLKLVLEAEASNEVTRA